MGVPQPHSLFAPCAPGLEPLLLDEVRSVGGVRPRAVPGGVELEANDHVLGRCLLELGLALDLRARVGELHVPGLEAITRGTAKLEWNKWIGPGQTVEVRASSRRSRIHHTGAIEARVLAGIRESAGSLAAEDPDPWRVLARIERDHLTLSISLAGAPLSRRGYRLATAKAPLREDLARALLVLARWRPEMPLLDPFCGSGTLLIEAARLARDIPPGWDRSFHWQRAPIFEPERWAKVRASLAERRLERARAPILGSDRDAGAVRAARENAARAGVAEDVELFESALGGAPYLSEPPAGPGLWLSNPPFGARAAGGAKLPNLYQSIGQRFSRLPEGWRLGLLTSDPKLAHRAGVPLESAALLDHGGKKVRLYLSGPSGAAQSRQRPE